MTKISIVSPAFREGANLPVMYERLKAVLDGMGVDWEWVVVDDHSPDATFAVASALAERDPRVVVLRLARNCGSHMAVFCGLDHASGDCAVVMASDLQDPPEVLPELIESWRSGNKVVWAARAGREGLSWRARMLSKLFYLVVRRFVGVRNLPVTGADFFLIDRLALDVVKHYRDKNVNLFALVAWLNFPQGQVEYVKEARLHGSTGWTLARQIGLVVSTFTGFSYLPVRALSAFGIGFAFVGFLLAAEAVINALTGSPPEGFTTIVTLILLIGGMQMIMLGVMGEYMWKTLDEVRPRPRYLVERIAGTARSAPPGPSPVIPGRVADAPGSPRPCHPAEHPDPHTT